MLLSSIKTFNFLFFIPEYFLAVSILLLILFVSIVSRFETERNVKRIPMPLIPTCFFVVFCTLLILLSIDVTNVLIYDAQFIFDYLT